MPSKTICETINENSNSEYGNTNFPKQLTLLEHDILHYNVQKDTKLD